MSNRILITGANGYIGKHLFQFFRKKKIEVYGCDKNGTLKKNFIKADFSSDRVINYIKLKKVDVIIHLAATTIINDNKKNNAKCINNNFSKTKLLIEKLHIQKIYIKKFIFASSAAVYGFPKNKRIKEDHQIRPISIYGKSKYMVERFLKSRSFRILDKILVLRFFNVVGGNLLLLNHKKTLFNQLNSSIKRKNLFYINGENQPTKDGTNVRDFIDVNIVSKFILLALKKKLKKKYFVFNIGSGTGKSILEIINKLKKANLKFTYSFRKSKREDIPYSVSNNTKMRNFINISNKKLDTFKHIKKMFIK